MNLQEKIISIINELEPIHVMNTESLMGINERILQSVRALEIKYQVLSYPIKSTCESNDGSIITNHTIFRFQNGNVPEQVIDIELSSIQGQDKLSSSINALVTMYKIQLVCSDDLTETSIETKVSVKEEEAECIQESVLKQRNEREEAVRLEDPQPDVESNSLIQNEETDNSLFGQAQNLMAAEQGRETSLQSESEPSFENADFREIEHNGQQSFVEPMHESASEQVEESRMNIPQTLEEALKQVMVIPGNAESGKTFKEIWKAKPNLIRYFANNKKFSNIDAVPDEAYYIAHIASKIILENM